MLNHQLNFVFFLKEMSSFSLSKGIFLKCFPTAKLSLCCISSRLIYIMGFPGGTEVKESRSVVCLIPGSGRSPGEGNGYPLQYFCLENSMGSQNTGYD